MADSKNMKIAEKLAALKHQFSSTLEFKPLADAYISVINGFVDYYAGRPFLDPLDAVAEYYTIVVHAEAYQRPPNEYLKKKASPLLMLRDVLYGVELARKYTYGFEKIPDVYQEDVLVYREWMSSAGKSEGTIDTRMERIKRFLLYLSEHHCLTMEDLTIETMVGFVISLEGRRYTAQGKANILYTVRNYLSCPRIYSKLACDPIPLISGLHSRKHERLVSCYTASEVRKVLEAVARDGRQGKMLYLMMMLACVYGLRSCDIMQLRLSSINWKKKTLCICQQKTKHHVELPLTQAVCLALLDYLKNSRPDVLDPHVFIRQRSPYVPYSLQSRFSGKLEAFFKKAGVDTQGKHYGLHSLRHSLATELFSSEVPIHENAAILGHSTTQPTIGYIWSDVSHLKAAALEVIPYDS